MRISTKTLKILEATFWICAVVFTIGSIFADLGMAVALWREDKVILSILAFLPIAIPVLLTFGIVIAVLFVERNVKRTSDKHLRTVLSQHVAFTAYKPNVIRPNLWYPMLVFAYESDQPDLVEKCGQSLSEEVRRQADAYFGDAAQHFSPVTEQINSPISGGAHIRLVPRIDGFAFNPPSRVFSWEESIHHEEFRFRAPPEFDGNTCRGNLQIYANTVLIAELPLAIRVDSVKSTSPSDCRAIPEHARRYRKIFVSYSHDDIDVVSSHH